MAVSDQDILSRFPVGYHELHPNVSLNFQLNRFVGWANDGKMLDEIRGGGTPHFQLRRLDARDASAQR